MYSKFKSCPVHYLARLTLQSMGHLRAYLSWLQDACKSVFMTDATCFPGMEGSAIIKDDVLIGMLMNPLSHTTFDAEASHFNPQQTHCLTVCIMTGRKAAFLCCPAAKPHSI